EECRKVAGVLEHFIKGDNDLDRTLIPPKIIANAHGIAVVVLVKAGFVWTGRLGTGLVLSRLPNGTWSAPSAISAFGAGFGASIGAELVSCVFVMNTSEAVRGFTQSAQLQLGLNISIAAGPTGRSAEAGISSGSPLAPIYAYSKAKGLFAGLSLE
ncbi:hypothetical protein HDV05_001460, partial [Chytridiales sp. JEL 0842]